MKKLLLFFSLFIISSPTFTQSINKISGSTIDYIGEELIIYSIDDYLSELKTQIARVKIDDKGNFSTSFFNEETKKIIAKVGRDQFSMYVQPNAEYNINLSKREIYNYPGGMGDVSFYFLDLDTNDINYKILIFEDYQLNFLERFYNKHSIKSTEFLERLDTFKLNIENRYKADTNSYFKTYVKFSIASLDNLSFVGQRNEYEKYDFYIKPETVWYQNDRYMDYIKHYYKQYETQLSKEVSSEFYKGVIKSSPTMLMNALSGDYALKNVRLRELVLINMLSEMFYTKEYPQTNIINILDSLANTGLFNENRKIADNIEFRLLDLMPGTKMPHFFFEIDGERKYVNDFKGKHVYFQFIDYHSKKSLEDLRLLAPLVQKYAKHIEFVTVLVVDDETVDIMQSPTVFSEFLKQNNINWDISLTFRDEASLRRLSVSSYPYYILMDMGGYVVEAPAQSPRPNNEYETIENKFYHISRYYKDRDQDKEYGRE